MITVTGSLQVIVCLLAFSMAGCGKKDSGSSESLAAQNGHQNFPDQLSLLGLDESRGNTHFIWLGPRAMDPEYFENMARWMEGRSKAGATLWVDDESAKHVKRDLLFSNNARLNTLKVRNISAMYEDALSLSIEIAPALKNLESIERLDAVGRANPAARSDLLRLLALYTYGGLYSDVDNKYDSSSRHLKLKPVRQMGPFAESGLLHAPSYFGNITNNSILYVAAPGNADILSFLNSGVQKRASLSQVRHPGIPPLEPIAARETADYIIGETDRRLSTSPVGISKRDIDLRGLDRIVGTMVTTGPVHLREAAFGRNHPIPTRGYVSTLPGKVFVLDGQHAAWATPEDGKIYEKREHGIAASRQKQQRPRSYSMPTLRRRLF